VVNTVPTDGSVSHRTLNHEPLSSHDGLYKKRRAKRDRKRKNSSDRREKDWDTTARTGSLTCVGQFCKNGAKPSTEMKKFFYFPSTTTVGLKDTITRKT